MRKILLTLLYLLGAAMGIGAQTIVQTTPESVNIRNIINAASGPTIVNVSQNIGQTFHTLTWRYNQVDNCRLVIRLEASQDGATWFAVTQDGTESNSATAGNNAEVGLFGAGYYPAIRINLATFSDCGNGATRISATYTGTSSSALSPTGAFTGNQSGAVQKVVIAAGVNLPNGGSISRSARTPFGSILGQASIRFHSPAAGSCLVSIQGFSMQSGLLTQGTAQTITPSASVSRFLVDVEALDADVVQFVLGSCGADQGLVDIAYFFYPPGYDKSCAAVQIVNVSASGNTVVLSNAGNTFPRFRICHLSLAFASAVDFKLTQGTGANCGTGTADLTGTYRNVGTIALDFSRAITAKSMQSVCVNLSAAVNGGGIIMYSLN